MSGNNNEIISQYEEIDEIVKGFANSIETFTERMNVGYAELTAAMSTLFEAWKAPLAEKYKEKMTTHVTNIGDSTSRAESLKSILDDVANDLSAALDALREGEED